MRTIDEWMTELAALPPVFSEATDYGLDRLWAAIVNEGEDDIDSAPAPRTVSVG